MSAVTVAASQHAILAADSWQGYTARATAQVRAAVARNAALLVFAEYGSMALVTLLPPARRLTLASQLSGLQAFAQDYLALYQSLAKEYGTWIIAPSFPFALATAQDATPYVNRSWITGPNGETAYQDKIHMTRFENELLHITPGNGLTVVDTGEFRFATAICYDSEFPSLVHQQAQGGAHIIAVPSCTDSLLGYHRVMYCARARAVENQCFVIQAPLRGDAPWCEAIDVNVGVAGVFSPVDKGFPPDGTLAIGASGDEWVFADCDLEQMQRVREDGQVFNWRDHNNETRQAVQSITAQSVPAQSVTGQPSTE